MPTMPPEGTWPLRRTLLLLALLAFVARLGAVAVLGPERYESRGYLYYEEMADNLLEGRGLHRTLPYGHGDRHAIRTPGYPLLLAGLKLLPGDLPGKVALCGAAFGSVSVLLLAFLGMRCFGRRVGLVAGLLLALWPTAVVHDAAMQDTSLYSMLLLALLALGFVAADRASSRHGPWLFAAWGLVAAAGILVRVTLVLPVLALAAWLAWRAGQAVQAGQAVAHWSRRAALVAVALGTLALGLAPWLARNARVVGAPVLSSDTGRSLWLGHNPETFSVYPRESMDRAEERAWAALSQAEREHVRSLSGDELEQDAWFRQEAMRHAREHPAATMAGAVRKVGATFSPWMSPRAGPLKQLVHFVSWSLALAFGLWGAWRMRGSWKDLAPLWIPVLLLALHSAVFFGHSSYRAYGDALVLLLAAVPLAAMAERAPRPCGLLPRIATGRALAAMSLVLLALAIRLTAVLASGELRAPDQEWQRGHEIGAVARSLARGDGFADPFLFESGPTAAVGPGLPLLLAPAYRALGPSSEASWRLLVLINVAASALVAAALLGLGASLGHPRAGAIAALAWALDPLAILAVLGWQGHVFVLLATLGLASVVDLDRSLRGDGGALPLLPAALGASILVGAGLWLEPLLLPALLAWAAWRALTLRRSPRLAAVPALVLLFAGMQVLPWVLRNAREVGTFSIRSWAGPELFLGAVAGPGEPTPTHLTPIRNARERALLQELGEGPYVRRKLEEARQLVGERPGRWIAACATRYATFWLGRPSWWRPAPDHPLRAGAASAGRGAWHLGLALLAAAGLARAWRNPSVRVLGLVLAIYPVTYALTHVEARYRLPLEPLLLLLAVLAFLGARGGPGAGNRGSRCRDRVAVDDAAGPQHDAGRSAPP